MDSDTCNICETAPPVLECVECGMLQYCRVCAARMHEGIAGLRAHVLREIERGGEGGDVRRGSVATSANERDSSGGGGYGGSLIPRAPTFGGSGRAQSPPAGHAAVDTSGDVRLPSHPPPHDMSREGERQWYTSAHERVGAHRGELRHMAAAVRELRDRGLAVEEAEAREVKLKFSELRRLLNKTEEALLEEIKTKSARRLRDAAELGTAAQELDHYFATCESMFQNDGVLLRARLGVGRDAAVRATDIDALRGGLGDAAASQQALADSLLKLQDLDAGVFAKPASLDASAVADAIRTLGRAGVGVGPRPAGWAVLSSAPSQAARGAAAAAAAVGSGNGAPTSGAPRGLPAVDAAAAAEPATGTAVGAGMVGGGASGGGGAAVQRTATDLGGGARRAKGSPLPAARSHSYLKSLATGAGGGSGRRVPSPQPTARRRQRSASPPQRHRATSTSANLPTRHTQALRGRGDVHAALSRGDANAISALDGLCPSAAAAYTTSLRFTKARQREQLARKLAGTSSSGVRGAPRQR